MVGKVRVTLNTSRNNGDNLRKSKRSHTIFTYEFWGKDTSALDELIRVPYKIGPRTALGGNGMFLCGLYDTKSING